MKINIPFVASRAIPSPSGINDDGLALTVNAREFALSNDLPRLLNKPECPNPRRVDRTSKTGAYSRLVKVLSGADGQPAAVHLAHAGIQIVARKYDTPADGLASVYLDDTAQTGDLNGRTTMAVLHELGEDVDPDAHLEVKVIVGLDVDATLAVAEGRNYSTNVQGVDLVNASGGLDPIKDALGDRAESVSWFHGDSGEPAAHHVVARLALVASARDDAFAPTAVYGRGRSIAVKFGSLRSNGTYDPKHEQIKAVLPDAIEALDAFDRMQATAKQHFNDGQGTRSFGSRSVAVPDSTHGHVLHDGVAYVAYWATVRFLRDVGNGTVDWSRFDRVWARSAVAVIEKISDAVDRDEKGTSGVARNPHLFDAVAYTITQALAAANRAA